jgi:hypothetical protein
MHGRKVDNVFESIAILGSLKDAREFLPSCSAEDPYSRDMYMFFFRRLLQSWKLQYEMKRGHAGAGSCRLEGNR